MLNSNHPSLYSSSQKSKPDKKFLVYIGFKNLFLGSDSTKRLPVLEADYPQSIKHVRGENKELISILLSGYNIGRTEVYGISNNFLKVFNKFLNKEIKENDNVVIEYIFDGHGSAENTWLDNGHGESFSPEIFATTVAKSMGESQIIAEKKKASLEFRLKLHSCEGAYDPITESFETNAYGTAYKDIENIINETHNLAILYKSIQFSKENIIESLKQDLEYCKDLKKIQQKIDCYEKANFSKLKGAINRTRFEYTDEGVDVVNPGLISLCKKRIEYLKNLYTEEETQTSKANNESRFEYGYEATDKDNRKRALLNSCKVEQECSQAPNAKNKRECYLKDRHLK